MTGHDHAVHAPGSKRGLKIAAWVTGAYFVFEMAVGLYTGSVMVIVDAAHTFSAVGGVVLALVAMKIARKPPTARQTFGGQRAEIIGALMNGAALLVMALVALTMGAMRLQSPIELPTTPMFVVAAVGLMTEVWLIALMYKDQKEDINTRGAFWHVVQTFLGSFGIIAAALVIHFTGFLLIDPILGMAFGVMVLVASWGILRDSISILMEHAPADIDVDEVCASLQAIDGVRDVHHPHAWTLTSGKHIFSGHLRIDDDSSAEQHARILDEAQSLLVNSFGFYFATLQLETFTPDEAGAHGLDLARGQEHGEHQDHGPGNTGSRETEQ
ncbi:cation transporter [Aquisalimonas sp. 2447]|uniref:cation diffusion facilitator family transporter n=1 Tax=Aquisalimonas sp. 2447 TaxID=2740807 RepID=UPI0014324790|nr:cation diffusion facilitator family transporter [Aquisalimonas sp. 2447]QIT54858.1 cation transporter [Aquisalimonas sp. 2447]